MSNGPPPATALTITDLQQIVMNSSIFDDDIGLQSWKCALDKFIPGWNRLIADPANYQNLLGCHPYENRERLMFLFVNTVGLDLALAWLDHKDQHAANAAHYFFSEKIHEAIENDNLHDVRYFVDIVKNKKYSAFEEMITRALVDSALRPNLEICEGLISNGACPCSKDKDGTTPLMHIAKSGLRGNVNKKVAELFKDCINDRDVIGRTALMYAAQGVGLSWNVYKGNVNFADILIEVGADVLVEDVNGRTALWWADHCNQGLTKGRNQAMISFLKKKMIIQQALIKCGRCFDFDSKGRILDMDRRHFYNITKQMKDWLQAKQNVLMPNIQLPPFPGVLLSEEAPPVFVNNPILKRRYEDDILDILGFKDNDKNFVDDPEEIEKYADGQDNQRTSGIKIEHIETESLLGAYYRSNNQIVLWRKGIDFCVKDLIYSNSNGISIDDLTRCVLIHELGHWFNAEAITPNNVRWDNTTLTVNLSMYNEVIGPLDPYDLGNPQRLMGDSFSLSSRFYHEAWAQFFAWLYGNEQDMGVLRAFEALEAIQSPPYQAWRQLVNAQPNPDSGPYTTSNLRWRQEKILASLEWSRSLAQPATFNDANFKNTNMIDWLKP